MGKRKKRSTDYTPSNMTPYIPCPIPEGYKPSELMDDKEWRKVARLMIRLKRLIDTN